MSVKGSKNKPEAIAGCAAKDCSRSHYAKGYCKKHYYQIKTYGRLTPELERVRGVRRVCKVPGCGRGDTVNWLCRKHHRQIDQYGKLTPEREHVMGNEGCNVPGCNEPFRAKGLCARHYNQRRWRMRQDGTVERRARAGRAKSKPKKAKAN